MLFAVWAVRNTLLLVLASIILVVLFTMPIRFFVRRGMGRSLATLISIAGMLGLFIILAMLVLPSLLQQFANLAVEVRAGVEEAVSQWDNIQNAPLDSELRQQYSGIASLQEFLQNTFQLNSLDELITQVTLQLGGALGALGGSVLPVVSGVASGLLNVVIIIFLSLYLLAEPRILYLPHCTCIPLGSPIVEDECFNFN